MTVTNCYCGSGTSFHQCCQPYISGTDKAPTAEALMRSRYSAYAVHNADYLWETTLPKKRHKHPKNEMLQWAKSNQWLKLEVLQASDSIVVFKAYYLDYRLRPHVHHEKSYFVKENNNWYYSDGEYPE